MIDHCLNITGIDHSEVNSIMFAFDEQKWATYCNERGIITLNIALDHVPIDMLKSVLIHELCHVLISGHGAVFNHMINKCDNNADSAYGYFRNISPLAAIHN